MIADDRVSWKERLIFCFSRDVLLRLGTLSAYLRLERLTQLRQSFCNFADYAGVVELLPSSNSAILTHAQFRGQHLGRSRSLSGLVSSRSPLYLQHEPTTQLKDATRIL